MRKNLQAPSFKPLLLKGLTTLWLMLITPWALAQAPAQCDTVYAVHDQGVQDSQFFTYDLNDNTLESLGQLYQGADFEGLSVHPQTQSLYATEGQPQSRLYTVDGETGDIALIGDLNADNAVALAFHPETADLHCWSDQGLLKLDQHTGASTLIWPQSQAEKQFFQATGPKAIQSLTWNKDGTKLYATADDQPNASTLWEYDNNGWHIACDELPKKVEGLETVSDGRLVYGFHQDTELGIHFYHANSCQTPPLKSTRPTMILKASLGPPKLARPQIKTL